MHIFMIAAENGALPGGKVGGLGDVIRDVPPALSRAGHSVDVLTPGYQSLSKLPGAQAVTTLDVEFAGRLETLVLFRVSAGMHGQRVTCWLLEHPLFAAGGEGMIYCSNNTEPYAVDATKFALFCTAACRALVAGILPAPDILHLHDWHTAALLLLRRTMPAYRPLASIPAVYTIHNLAMQGVRPFGSNPSSLDAWFPGLQVDPGVVADPAHPDCLNLMRAGINLADRVHTVSPTYAREIIEPSDPAKGFIGGEGLEGDLRRADAAGRLAGILNGCEYPEQSMAPVTRQQFTTLADAALLRWIGASRQVGAAHFLAMERLRRWQERPDGGLVVASVGRLTAQKVGLLAGECEPGVTALDRILGNPRTALYVMLGSGDSWWEDAMVKHMARHENFIFLQGFANTLADFLYRFCDLFLMPSTFEPCGISQMLALRAGKPCLVHKVGGLADTVGHGRNGFTFDGDSPAEQVRQMLAVYANALAMHDERPRMWQKLCKAAAASRFSWDQSIEAYEEKLYFPHRIPN